jgi:hypothetical protein
LRGLLAQSGRLPFDQGKQFDQTGVLSQSDNHVRQRRESRSAYCPAKLSISRSRSRKSPVKGLLCLTQTARNSANAPLVMHCRKWSVKFKIGEREFYYGLFTDLDEAKRVCAAARLEHDPKARARDDSTAHLTDAEIDERFAFDNNNDPVWRDKPLAGDDLTIRDNFRWNNRHGGKKLDKRVGSCATAAW